MLSNASTITDNFDQAVRSAALRLVLSRHVGPVTADESPRFYMHDQDLAYGRHSAGYSIHPATGYVGGHRAEELAVSA